MYWRSRRCRPAPTTCAATGSTACAGCSSASRTRPCCSAIALLSLAGIPPFPGFVAKFLIFKNVVAAGYTLYAVLGLVGSYLGIYFYLRVIQLMFMGERPDVPSDGRIAIGAGVLCLVPTISADGVPGILHRPGRPLTHARLTAGRASHRGAAGRSHRVALALGSVPPDRPRAMHLLSAAVQVFWPSRNCGAFDG